MQVNITACLEPEENQEFMTEISALVDFSDPPHLSLENVFKSNFGLKERIQEYYNVKVDITYDSEEVSILILETDEEEDLVQLLEEMRADLIESVESQNFVVNSFAILFNEIRIPEDSKTSSTVEKGGMLN